VVLVGGRCVSVTRGVLLRVGNIMREVIIRSLAATAVLGGLFFGGGVAAAGPAPAAAPAHTEVTCPLGTELDKMSHVCAPIGVSF
jgi:hypothetical protein